MGVSQYLQGSSPGEMGFKMNRNSLATGRKFRHMRSKPTKSVRYKSLS
jgi:hypothetical protein